MKRLYVNSILLILIVLLCNCTKQGAENTVSISNDNDSQPVKGQASVIESSKANILKVAISSPDHTTLVKAVQAAGIADVLANNGPFTVFAPTNDAFAALPEGTVATLLKPENKSKLVDILYYHAAPGIYKGKLLKDGRQIYEANGDNVEIKVKEDGSVTVNGANILASIETTNGVVHVIDAVLLPPE